jgi:hypothetical protein
MRPDFPNNWERKKSSDRSSAAGTPPVTVMGFRHLSQSGTLSSFTFTGRLPLAERGKTDLQ